MKPTEQEDKGESFETKTSLSIADLEKRISPDKYYEIDLAFANEAEYTSLFSILSDMEFVKENISRLIATKVEPDSDDEVKLNSLIDIPNAKVVFMKRNLLITAIVTYSRCFNKSWGRIRNLKPNECFGGLPDSLKEYNLLAFHKEIIDIRNQYIAHAGISNSEEYSTKIKFKIIEHRGIQLKLAPEGKGLYSFSDNELNTFSLLLTQIIEWISERLKELEDNFFNSISDEQIDNGLLKVYEKLQTH